jgi:hypothetical protein
MPLSGKTTNLENEGWKDRAKEDGQGAVSEKGVGKPLLEVAVDQTPYPPQSANDQICGTPSGQVRAAGNAHRRRQPEGVENAKAALLEYDYRYKPGGKQNQRRVAAKAEQRLGTATNSPLVIANLQFAARPAPRGMIADHPAMTIARGSPQGLRQGLRQGLSKRLPARSAWPIPP